MAGLLRVRRDGGRQLFSQNANCSVVGAAPDTGIYSQFSTHSKREAEDLQKTRSPTQKTAGSHAAEEQEDSSVKDLCVKLLADGCVQTFVDVFELSKSLHQDEEIALQRKIDEEVLAGHRSALSSARQKRQFVRFQLNSHLEQMSSKMAEAEEAVWEECWEKALCLYHEVASSFASSKKWTLALHFLQRCVAISQETDKLPELAAIFRELGDVHKNQGKWEEACEAYKASLDVSAKVESTDEKKKAAEALSVGCAELARHRVRNNLLEEAKQLLQESLRCARTSANARLECEALHYIGDLMCRLGNYEEAVAAHEQCIERSREEGDLARENEARAALATALRNAGRLDEATEELERLLRAAENSHDSGAQAAACMSLGSLHNGKGDSVRAHEMIKKYFDITTAIGDRLPLEEARIMLGISKAKCSMEEYKKLFRRDIGDLLAWKSLRIMQRSDAHIQERARDGVASESEGAQSAEALVEAQPT